MNRMMILATALLVVIAGMSVTQEANAGLFNRNKCCKTQECSKPKKCRQGLFAKRKAKKCCQQQQTCCAPEPSCCEAAPVCCAAPACAAPAPAPCGCEVVSTCGCEETISCDCLSKRKLRRANRKGQCCGAVANSCNTCSAPVSTCGCESAAPAGCSNSSGSQSAPVYQSTPAPEEAAPEAPESTT